MPLREQDFANLIIYNLQHTSKDLDHELLNGGRLGFTMMTINIIAILTGRDPLINPNNHTFTVGLNGPYSKDLIDRYDSWESDDHLLKHKILNDYKLDPETYKISLIHEFNIDDFSTDLRVFISKFARPLYDAYCYDFIDIYHQEPQWQLTSEINKANPGWSYPAYDINHAVYFFKQHPQLQFWKEATDSWINQL